ncbi:DUF4288 domain-containing protein [Paraflavisolibacter sp. H34]|uniref:DUF4288 domain-containing protein n=1 Tax=Huijunlia imazamoxiresistens TaxID=3127457 RepID=UPI003015B96D
MKWYIAKIVFRIVCGDGTHRPQFDEQLRLIAAADREEAFQKACDLGKAEDETFYNQYGQPVHWEFINVPEVYRFALTEGTELYSQIQEVDNAETYIELAHAKAERMSRKAKLTM